MCGCKLHSPKKFGTGSVAYRCKCDKITGLFWLLGKDGKWKYWSHRHSSWVRYGNKKKPILISKPFTFR